MTPHDDPRAPVVLGLAILLTSFTALAAIPIPFITSKEYTLLVSVWPAWAILWLTRYYLAPVLIGSNVLLLGGLIVTRSNWHSIPIVACQLGLGLMLVLGDTLTTPLKWYDCQNAMKSPQVFIGVLQASLGVISLFEAPYGVGQVLSTTLACWYIVMVGWRSARIDSGLVAVGMLVAALVEAKGWAPKAWCGSQIFLVSWAWTDHWLMAKLDPDKEMPGPGGVPTRVIRNLQKYTREFQRDWSLWEDDLDSDSSHVKMMIYELAHTTTVTSWSNLPFECGESKALFKAEMDRRIVKVIADLSPEACRTLITEVVAPTYLKSLPKHEVTAIPERAAAYLDWQHGTPGLFEDWQNFYNVVSAEYQSQDRPACYGIVGEQVLKVMVKGQRGYQAWCFSNYTRLSRYSMYVLGGWVKYWVEAECSKLDPSRRFPDPIRHLLEADVPLDTRPADLAVMVLEALAQANHQSGGAPKSLGPAVKESGPGEASANRWQTIKLLS